MEGSGLNLLEKNQILFGNNGLKSYPHLTGSLDYDIMKVEDKKGENLKRSKQIKTIK